MLRVQRAANGHVVFTLSGRMETESMGQLEALLKAEMNGGGVQIVLDLKDLTLVNQDAVSFLDRCESQSIMLRNCPPYIREWIRRNRRGS
jgi:anti-anti-sigma regulatory factor